MNSFQPLLALTLACSVIACAKPADRSSDSAIATTALAPSSAQLVGACRDTVARDNPTVRWVPDTALSADLNYDGSSELVVWGSEADSLFVLAIVECSGNRPGRVWTFPFNALGLFGTRELTITLGDPTLGEGYLDENCIRTDTTSECRHLRKIDPQLAAAYSRGGRGLSIGIEDRDHLYLYWDPEFAKFVSWRP
jgi:hypothetical protein